MGDLLEIMVNSKDLWMNIEDFRVTVGKINSFLIHPNFRIFHRIPYVYKTID